MAILVNGNGNARVYAAQDADLIASITGNQTVRTSVGNKMAATAADASTISVADGVILTKEGRRIQLDAGQTDLFTIPTGSAGVTNYYIIGYKLTTNSDNVQVAETFVQLMASSTDTIPEGTFRGGDSEVYVSVARVEQDGVNLGTITALLPELETISELNNDLSDVKSELVDRVIATATANQTIAAQLTYLKSFFDALDVSDKKRSYLLMGNTMFNVFDIAVGQYTAVHVLSAYTILDEIDITHSTYYESSNGTVTNASTNTNTNTLALCVR